MSVLFRVYFIHLRRKVQRQDIQAALCYRQPERCVNTGSGDRRCLRRPTFGVEGQRADLLTVQCDLHPSAASRGHTQCGIASGMGAESGSGNSNVQKNKEVNADNKFGIDVILMNHNMPNIQNVIDLLGGD